MSEFRIAVNTRIAGHGLTGQPRYLLETIERIGPVQRLAPRRPLTGARGHLWEQVTLPARARSRLLWSPSSTGPLTIERQVVTIHDTATLDHPEWFDARFAGWYAFLLPRLARRVRRVIAISEFTKQRVMEHSGIDPSKIVVIPNGVDARFSPRGDHEIAAARARLGLPEGPYVLTLGSLEPRKNVAGLLAAWQEVSRELPEANLVIAGAVGAGHVFRSAGMAPRADRVHLTGHVADEFLPALLSGANLFVFPSLYEGFGLPPLEAMACGTAVLCSDRASLPEVVGDAAATFDPDSGDQLSEQLAGLMQDGVRRAALAARGSERAKLFTWDETARRVSEVLRAAL